MGEINRGSDGDEERKDNGFYCRWKSPCIECIGLNGLKGKRSLTGKKKNSAGEDLVRGVRPVFGHDAYEKMVLDW